jgi:hypothetical protein
MIGTQDRRRCERRPMRWPVCIWHSTVGRFVRASTRDLSKEGLAITAPLSIPFAMGQVVEVSFPNDLPSATLMSLRPVHARVTHVCKDEAFLQGEQIVGLSFVEKTVSC